MANNFWNIGNGVGAGIQSAIRSAAQDPRLTEVEDDKKAALTENEETYNGMINSADKYYDAQIEASEDWAERQSQLQQEQHEFTVDKIEQEKAQAQKDYTKEQSGAYVDWQKQSNQYGVNAEQMAASGLHNSGFSESSQVAMYTAYQNRVALARASFEQTKQNFANAIKEAQLQNSSLLAEIAFKAQQEQLELNMQRYLNGQTLLLEKLRANREIEQTYYNRSQDVLSQINTEKALAEQVRQFNAELEEEKRQFDITYGLRSGEYISDKVEDKDDGSSGSTSKKFTFSSPTSYMDAADPTIKSILDLGFGPISAYKLNNLVKSGEVIEYTENGVTKFRINKNYKPKSRETKPWTYSSNSLIPPNIQNPVLKR